MVLDIVRSMISIRSQVELEKVKGIEKVIDIVVTRPYYNPVVGQVFSIKFAYTDGKGYYIVERHLVSPRTIVTIYSKEFSDLFKAKMAVLIMYVEYLRNITVLGGLRITIAVFSEVAEDLAKEIEGISELIISSKPYYRVASPNISISLVKAY